MTPNDARVQENIFAFLNDPVAHPHAKRIGTHAIAEVTGLQENYDLGPIDWTIIDASGTLEQTLKQYQNLNAGAVIA